MKSMFLIMVIALMTYSCSKDKVIVTMTARTDSGTPTEIGFSAAGQYCGFQHLEAGETKSLELDAALGDPVRVYVNPSHSGPVTISVVADQDGTTINTRRLNLQAYQEGEIEFLIGDKDPGGTFNLIINP